MATATFERQAELLETIHACRRELQELTGDPLEIIVRPSPGSPSPDELDTDGERGRVVGITEPAQPGEDLQAMVVAALKLGEWTAPKVIAERTGINKHTLRDHLARLRAAGILEHNGVTARGSRWRLLPGGASSNGHQLSQRVRKGIERAEREPVEPQPDPASPLDRVRRACAEDAATITELALRLDLPRRDIASAVEQLLDQDRIVKCGKRQLTGHAVYGAHDD